MLIYVFFFVCSFMLAYQGKSFCSCSAFFCFVWFTFFST